MEGLRATNIDDRVLIFGIYCPTQSPNTQYSNGPNQFQKFSEVKVLKGTFSGGYGYDGYYSDDILEYDSEEDSMIPVGHMTRARAWHALSVVQEKDYIQWCM